MGETTNNDITRFLDKLQLEYIVADIRANVFQRSVDKGFWQKVAKKKKEKILDLTNKRGFLSIFDFDLIWKNYYEQVVPLYGLPKFSYLNKNQETKLSFYDKLNYFFPETEISFINDHGEEEQGIIVSIDVNKELIKIACTDRDKVQSSINKLDFTYPVIILNNFSRIARN